MTRIVFILTQKTAWLLSVIQGRLPGRPAVIRRSFNVIKHTVVLQYLTWWHAGLGRQAEPGPAPLPRQATQNVAPARIGWVLWLQGFEAAPPIIKLCLASIKKHLVGYQLNLLSESNISDYITLPVSVSSARAAGHISDAHFSDYVRMHLLAEHGGLWVDATMLLSRPVEALHLTSFISVTGPPTAHKENISDRRWAIFLMGGPVDCAVWRIAATMLDDYWTSHTQVVDYHLTDYVVHKVFTEIGGSHPWADGNEYVRESVYHITPEVLASDKAAIGSVVARASWHKLSWKWGDSQPLMDGLRNLSEHLDLDFP